MGVLQVARAVDEYHRPAIRFFGFINSGVNVHAVRCFEGHQLGLPPGITFESLGRRVRDLLGLGISLIIQHEQFPGRVAVGIAERKFGFIGREFGFVSPFGGCQPSARSAGNGHFVKLLFAGMHLVGSEVKMLFVLGMKDALYFKFPLGKLRLFPTFHIQRIKMRVAVGFADKVNCRIVNPAQLSGALRVAAHARPSYPGFVTLAVQWLQTERIQVEGHDPAIFVVH